MVFLEYATWRDSEDTETAGARPAAVPGHDSPGLYDGRANGCRDGHSGFAGSDNRTGMFGRWQNGLSHSPMFARGRTGLNLCQQTDDEHLPHQGFRAFSRSTMGHMCSGVPSRNWKSSPTSGWSFLGRAAVPRLHQILLQQNQSQRRKATQSGREGARALRLLRRRWSPSRP